MQSEEHPNMDFSSRKGLVRFFWSFINASKGLRLMMNSQPNFYVHLLAMLVTLFTAFYFPLSNVERSIIVIMIAVVISAEIFNSSIEKLSDQVDKSFNIKIGQIKDMAAAAVLVLAIASLAVAILIFWPYLQM